MSRKKKLETIADLTPDDKNANRGTERGRAMLEDSIRSFGFLEAGTLDRNGRIIGGNKRTEVAAEVGLDEDIVVVDTDGTKPVYIRRNDLDLDTHEGRAAAIALNRTAQVSIDFEPVTVKLLEESGVDLSKSFSDRERAKLYFEMIPKAINELEKAMQLEPPREYVLVMCETDQEFGEMRQRLGLEDVRRGGYNEESDRDSVGVERVVLWKKMKQMLKRQKRQ